MTAYSKTVAVIGGGAAGFFSAITCAEAHPEATIIILEKTRQVLSKVKISGGGRCNVTHSCFDPAELIKFYPRGFKELRGAFSQFQPKDTVAWFEKRGVKLKTEEDGRMFPVTDSSLTIIDCLLSSAKLAGVKTSYEVGLESVDKTENGFLLHLSNQESMHVDRIIFSSGSQKKVWELLRTLGHTIIDAVPSLFTFNIPDSPLLDLAGISVSNVSVTLPKFKLSRQGPLLITHWGLSGPAVLKTSAWGARELFACNYETEIHIDWLPDHNVSDDLTKAKLEHSSKTVHSTTLFPLPKKLWKRLLLLSEIDETLRWSHLSKEKLKRLTLSLKQYSMQIKGKTTNKEEFVTAGGVKLSEVNFKTMESKIVPGIFFAGEILDIDGVTGGFNFQNAWTTGWIAGQNALPR